MRDWIGIVGVVALLLVFILYGLLKDRDPRSMNPRPFAAEERGNWRKFQHANFAIFVLSLVIISLLAAFLRWLWMR